MTDFSTLKAALQGKSKSALTLLQGAKYDWLAPFETTFDDRVAEYVRDLAGKHDNPYDPFAVEPLLADIATLLDRCQLYRREIHELEAAAIRQALEYALFTQQQPILQQLDEAAYFAQQRGAEKTAHQAAATAFGKSDDTLAPGFAEIAKGTAQAAQEAIAGDQQRRQLLATKYQLLNEYQQALQTRHRAPGDALNFTERVDRLLAFVQGDIRIAYLKAEAASVGLERAFAIKQAVPQPDAPRLLDELVMWARAVAEDLAINNQREVEFERLISLREVLGDDEYKNVIADALKEPTPVEEEDGWWFVDKLGKHEKPVKPGKPSPVMRPSFGVTITDKHLGVRGDERYRLKAMGASFSCIDYDTPKVRLWRLTMAIFPPTPQIGVGPYGNLAQYRPPAVLTNVALTDPRTVVAWTAPYATRNIDPRGFWKVVVSTSVGVPHNQARKQLDANEIYDINLHLLVSTVRKDAPTRWEHFRW